MTSSNSSAEIVREVGFEMDVAYFASLPIQDPSLPEGSSSSLGQGHPMNEVVRWITQNEGTTDVDYPGATWLKQHPSVQPKPLVSREFDARHHMFHQKRRIAIDCRTEQLPHSSFNPSSYDRLCYRAKTKKRRDLSSQLFEGKISLLRFANPNAEDTKRRTRKDS